jgi:DNA-binding transcriptional regulator YhcF (GntR family)
MDTVSLDPDDPRPPYAQVSSALRAAIRTRKFAPGDKLPSTPALARNYGVARATVQRAIRDLQAEGLVVTRQGSGVFVRERAERPASACGAPHVLEHERRLNLLDGWGNEDCRRALAYLSGYVPEAFDLAAKQIAQHEAYPKTVDKDGDGG